MDNYNIMNDLLYKYKRQPSFSKTPPILLTQELRQCNVRTHFEQKHALDKIGWIQTAKLTFRTGLKARAEMLLIKHISLQT